MITLQDNRGRFTEGNRVVLRKEKELKALQKLSTKTVWDLVFDDNVMFIESSLGRKNLNNKDRKVVEIGSFDQDNEEIHACAYTENVMGFICVDGVEIFITSRFEEPGETKFLLYLLSQTMGWSLTKEMVSENPHTEALKDLQYMLFPKFLKEALTQGLIKTYKRVEYNDMKVRGRLDISRHITHNTPFNGRIAYSSREYMEDNDVTQLIRHTIEFIKREYVSRREKSNYNHIFDQATNNAIEIIYNATPGYNIKDFSRVLNNNIKNPVSHPYYTRYRALQELCISILKRKKIGLGGKKKKGIHGILFDGAWLWEEYIAYVLNKKHDDSNEIAFRHYTDKNSNFSLFEGFIQKIIPDYMSDDYNESDNKATAVGDAKYMRLEGRDKLQGEQAYSVYYKTIMYMHRFNSKKGFIFYPMEANAEGSPYDLNEFTIAGTESKMYMCGYRIPHVQGKDFSAFRTDMEEAEIKFKEVVSQHLKNHKSHLRDAERKA